MWISGCGARLRASHVVPAFCAPIPMKSGYIEILLKPCGFRSGARSLGRRGQSSSRTRRLSSQAAVRGGPSEMLGEPPHKAGEPVALVLQSVPSDGRVAAAAEGLDLFRPVALQGAEGGGVVAGVVEAGRQAVL